MSEAINRLGDAKDFVSLGYTHSALMAIDDAIKILQAAQAQAGDGEAVAFPVSEDQAACMVLLGTKYLKDTGSSKLIISQQAQVNQQLLEALQSHRVDVWADSYENKIVVDPDENGDFVYYDAVVAAIAAAQESPQVSVNQQLLEDQLHLLSILNGNIWHTEESEKIKLPTGFELKLYASKAAIAAAQEQGK